MKESPLKNLIHVPHSLSVPMNEGAPKATPIMGWLQNCYCQVHVAANGFCCLYLLFSVSVPAPSSLLKCLTLAPTTYMYYMYMYVLVYSLLHICDSMAGHREGMRTVQWLGTEKACVLYNGWAQRRHAYCVMAGHREGMRTV